MSYSSRDWRLTPDQLYNLTTGGGMSRRFPESEDDWQREYGRRHEAYVGDPWSVADMKALHLFRALDENGDVLAETRRLTQDYRFVCDTDTAALLGDGLSLQGADRADGLAVWERSGLVLHSERYAREFAVKGDIHFEAVMGSDGLARVVAYSPEHVTVTYDPETATRIVRAIVTIPYFDAPDVDGQGNVSEEHQILHTYRRVITPDRIDVYRDGALQPGESGANTLGVCSLVHVPFIPYTCPEHGLNAAHRLDDSLALIDSLLTQIQAIGARHGNPLLASAGAQVDADSDVFKLGRTVNGPADWSLGYVEPSFAGISSLLETAQQHRETLRETLPEFLFTESGANSSGSALNFRASQFVQKMRPIRQRLHGAIALATALAVHLDRGTRPGASAVVLHVEAGDILPANVTATLEQLRVVEESLGGLLPADRVAALQRVGLVPKDVDPARYASELADERRPDMEPPKDGDTGSLPEAPTPEADE